MTDPAERRPSSTRSPRPPNAQSPPNSAALRDFRSVDLMRARGEFLTTRRRAAPEPKLAGGLPPRRCALPRTARPAPRPRSRASAAGRAAAPRISGRRPDRARGGSRRRNRRRVFGPKPVRGRCPAIGRGVPGRVAVSHRPAEAAYFHSSVGAEPIRGVVARIVTGPHDANRQDPHLPMRYDTGRPRAVIRLRISQPRTTSLPCPAGLRARRLSPFATHGHGRRPVRAAVCRIPCLILCLADVVRVGQCRAPYAPWALVR